MTYNEARKKATIKFIKKTYKQLVIRYKAEEYKFHIEPAIKESGLSVTSFVKTAVEEKIIRDFLHLEPEERPQNKVLSEEISSLNKCTNLSSIHEPWKDRRPEYQDLVRDYIDTFCDDYNVAKETGKIKEFFEENSRYILWMKKCWAMTRDEWNELPEEIKTLDDTARRIRFLGKDKAIEALDLMMEKAFDFVKKERWDLVIAIGECLCNGFGGFHEHY